MSNNQNGPKTTNAKPQETEPATAFAFPQIPNLKDIFTGELARHGRWVVANVDSNGSWPIKAQKCRYRGEEIWIIPLTQECYGGVAILERDGLDTAACQKLLMRFLSAISWVYEQGIALSHGFSGGDLPRPMGRPNRIGGSIISSFDLTDCPEPTNDRALLALALVREGRALGHAGYSFLSFYRVLEVAFPDGPQRGQWIAAKIPTLAGHFAKPAVAKLIASGVDVATHLRESNRHAIAHAKAEPVIDPDDPAESRRLMEETPIVIELAVLAIEEVFGVETRHTIYRKHLYELAGFKKVIGDEMVERVTAGEQLPAGTMINIPDVNVGLQERSPTKPLLSLKVKKMQQHEKKLLLIYENERVIMQVGLNFGDERLEFEMLTDIRMRDDGTADAAADQIEYTEFLNALFGNGQLHLYDSETGELLGRKDAYLPVNMMYDHNRAKAHLASLKETEQRRRRLEAGGAEVKYHWNVAAGGIWTARHAG